MQEFILSTNSYSSSKSIAEERGVDFEFTDRPLADLPLLKHHYSSLIIQIDKMRWDLLHHDTTKRPSDVADEEKASWSIREHLGFLINSDQDVWYPRIMRTVNEENPSLENLSIELLMQSHHWQETPVENLIAQLMRVRWNASSLICALPEASFSRTAIHPTHGTITLHQILQHLVDEDKANIVAIRDLLLESDRIDVAVVT